jgi:hypothetical protein
MKFDIIRKKISLFGASGLLTVGAGAGIAAVAHPAMAAPAATTTDTGDTVEVVEGPGDTTQGPATTGAATTGAATTEAPEVPETSKTDAAGGHADAPGANVDNQHQGTGESDG